MVEGAALCAIGLHPALTLKCIEPDIINFAARESLRLTGFIKIIFRTRVRSASMHNESPPYLSYK